MTLRRDFPEGVLDDATSPSRRALIEQISTTRQPIVLISGPAGSGKTALVESWQRRAYNETDVRVLTVSRRHNDAVSLLSAIFGALGAAETQAGTEDIGSWIDELTQSLSSEPTHEQPTWLVLDRTEQLSDPDAQLVLSDLVDNLPVALRLIVTTRQRCPGWLKHGRANGNTLTITAQDLVLTPEDARQLVGDELPEFAGWALGISMVGARGRAEADQVVRDYFEAEVMSRITTEMRHILYAVSVCNEVNPELAMNLAGSTEAGRLLSQFAASTQLLTTSPGPTFSLHPVLAQYIREEFARDDWLGFVALRTRHADWLASHGDLAAAVNIYLDVNAAQAAREQLHAQWQGQVLGGRVATVVSALDQLPSDELARDPRMCLVKAMTYLATGNHEQWRRWADVARAQDDTEMEPGLSVHAAITASERFALAVTTGNAPARQSDRSFHGLWAAIDQVADGLCGVWSGRYGAARGAFERAEVAARVSGDQLALVHALSGIALADAFAGTGNPLATADEAIAIADRLPAACRWVVANAHLALSVFHLAAGSNAGARVAAGEVLNALDDVPDHVEQRTRSQAAEILKVLAGVGSAPAERPKREQVGTVGEGSSEALTDRERRVLRALCGPLTLREIADELYVSHNTVKTQVASIFKKLGVHDRAAAVAAARSRTLVKR